MLNYDVLFELAASEMIGSSNLSLVIDSLTISSRSLAETLLQYAATRNKNAAKVLKGLTTKIKSAKAYSLAELTASRAASRGYVLITKEIFVGFVVPVVLGDLPTSNIYEEGASLVREILSQQQVKLSGVINK